MAREIQVSRSKCRNYFEKGMQYYSQAEIALKNMAYSVAASNSIHAAILFLDSVSIADLGLRSSPQSHLDSAHLFKRANIKGKPEEKDNTAKIFIKMVQEKSAIEYTDDEISKANAEYFLHNAGKIMRFAKHELLELGYI